MATHDGWTCKNTSSIFKFKEGGFVLIGISEDENKDLIFEGLENTEKKKDDQFAHWKKAFKYR